MFRILLSTYAVCVAMTGSVRASELSLTYGFEQSLTLDEAGPTEDSVGSGVGETSQPVRVSSVHTDSDADLLLVNDSFDQSIELNPVTGLERFFEQLGEGSWISGAEATFMKVNGDVDGRMTMSFDDSGTAGTDYRGIGGRGLDTSSVAPRVWIGRQLTPKWAIVTRYQTMSDSASGAPETPAGQVNLPHFATMLERQQLEMAAFDIEGIRSFTVAGFKLDAAVGGRRATMDYGNQMSAHGVFTSGNFVNLHFRNGGNFEGTGVTYGLTARRQIMESPLVFFIGARGSNLVGESTAYSGVSGTIASSPSAPLVGAATVTRSNMDATASIGELQTGLQLEFELKHYPASAFFRTAFEYQYWNLDARPVGGAGFGGTIGDLTTNSFGAIGGDPSVTMLGISLATGLNW